MTHRLTAIALLLAAGTACGITETGNPELQVGLEGNSSDPSVDLGTSTLRTALPPITVDQAYILVDRIRLSEADGCDTARESEHSIDGPFLVDLKGEPTFAIGRVPATDYCRLRIDLDRADDGPPELLGNTVWIAGTLGDGTPFDIRAEVDDSLDLRSRNQPFTIDQANAAIVVAFDVGLWLTDLGLETGTLVDGVIVVDEETNADLLELFESRIEAEAYDDDDEDGEVDDDEEGIAD